MLTISKNLVSFMMFDLFGVLTYLSCWYCLLVFYTSICFTYPKNALIFFWYFLFLCIFSPFLGHFSLYNHTQHSYQSMFFIAMAILSILCWISPSHCKIEHITIIIELIMNGGNLCLIFIFIKMFIALKLMTVLFL